MAAFNCTIEGFCLNLAVLRYSALFEGSSQIIIGIKTDTADILNSTLNLKITGVRIPPFYPNKTLNQQNLYSTTTPSSLINNSLFKFVVVSAFTL